MIDRFLGPVNSGHVQLMVETIMGIVCHVRRMNIARGLFSQRIVDINFVSVMALGSGLRLTYQYMLHQQLLDRTHS